MYQKRIILHLKTTGGIHISGISESRNKVKKKTMQKIKRLFIYGLLTIALCVPSFIIFNFNEDNPHDIKMALSVIMAERLRSLKENCKLIHSDLQPESFYTEEIDTVLAVNQYRLCKVAKCGCTYWLEVFLVMKKIIQPDALLNIGRQKLHFEYNSNVLLQHYEQNETDILIMVTRNPWHRLFSAYMDKIYRQQIDFMTLIKQINDDCNKIPTFQEFLDFIVKTATAKIELNVHWRPISNLCKVCAYNYTYIVKHEQFTEESQFVLNQLWPQPSKEKDVLISLLTDKFTENSIDQLTEQFVHETPNNKCVNFLDKMRRLWISLQSQGLISDTIAFDDSLFLNSSTESIKENRDIFVKSGNLIKLTQAERQIQRYRHFVHAYSAVKNETLVAIQRIFWNDFLLFGYNEGLPV